MAGLGRNYEVLGRVTGFQGRANEHTGIYDFEDDEEEVEEIAAQRWW